MKRLWTVFVLASIVMASTPASLGAQRARSGGPAKPDAVAILKQDMRELWTDHVVWTRDYIIAAVADQPDATAAAGRLMKNQEDIGAAIAKYYGAPAGQQLTTLLKEHITGAVDVIKAAKSGDKAALQKADIAWQDNAMRIADFLSKANPNWPKPTLEEMMKTHLSTTTAEVVARIGKNWDEDVRAFDAVYDHILKMSDALSDGIVKQFPDKFGITSPAPGRSR